jgi:hypothetical protein
VDDFNNKRPMQVLKGFTPSEIYSNTKPDCNFIELRQQDSLKRKENNKNSPCKACELLM